MERNFNDNIAAVLEEAERQQDVARQLQTELATAIERLSNTSTELQKQIRQKIQNETELLRQTAAQQLQEPLAKAGVAAAEATAAYRSAATWALWKVALLAVFFAACGIGAMVLTAFAVLPDAAEIQALRLREAELIRTIAILTERGGNARLGRCEDKQKRVHACVQIDTEKGVFGDSYYVIKGH